MLKFLQFGLLALISLSVSAPVFSQGEMWGVTKNGGVSDMGVIFKTTGDGTHFSIQHTFTTPYPGRNPFGDLVQASNGKFYGMTYSGGPRNTGVLFEFDGQTNVYTVKQSFDSLNMWAPSGSLTKGANGNLYGMSVRGGGSGVGFLFEYDFVKNQIIRRIDFNSSSGAHGAASLCLASNGKLYGTTYSGGLFGYGTIFEFIEGTNSLTVIFDFHPFFGFQVDHLMQASNGQLYGMANGGGIYGFGTLIEYNLITNQVSKKIDFDFLNGAFPQGGLCEGSAGKLYGMTPSGGANSQGVLFEYNFSSGNLSKKLDFKDTLRGSFPYGGMAKAPNGKLYGMTYTGGHYNTGYIFEYNHQTDTYLTKIEFNALNGGGATGSFILGSDGKFYGMTANGGLGGGTILGYDPNANLHTKRIDFNYAEYGCNPSGRLIQYTDGNLYGVAEGGTHAEGIIYKINLLNKSFTKVFDFDGLNGRTPNSLILASNGKMYGTTVNGGVGNFGGVIFEFDPISNSFSKKFDFNQGELSVSGPLYSALIEPVNGKLYGTTYTGGANYEGVLFEFDFINNQYTRKFDFSGPLGGKPMASPLTKAVDGKLYGMTSSGGANNKGVIFSYDLVTNTFSKKFDFDGINGESPKGGFTLVNGKLFATAYGGGNTNNGIVFAYDPSADHFQKNKDFDFLIGSNPSGDLTLAPNGKLYGMTLNGGSKGGGVLFEYEPSANRLMPRSAFLDYGASFPLYSSVLPIGQAQTIDFPPLPVKSVGDSFALSASASSGLPIHFASSDTTVAMIVGSLATITGAGTVKITASQAGEGMVHPAPDAFQNVTAVKLDQEITFAQIAPKTFGDPAFLLVATANSGLHVDLNSSDPDIATVKGDTVEIINAGMVVLTALQSGNNKYNPAQSVQRSLTITKKSQQIAFTPPSEKTFGDPPFLLVAATSSGLEPSFSSSNPDIAVVNGHTLEIRNAGTVIVTAMQPGNSNYDSTQRVQHTLTIRKSSQQIIFTPIAERTFGDLPFMLNAVATSGLSVVFSSPNSSIINLINNEVTIVGAGSVSINAFQEGNSNYNSSSATQSFCILPAQPRISITGNDAGTSTLTSSNPTGNQWYLNGIAMDGEKGEIHVAKVSGIYWVTVTVDACTSEASPPVSVVVTGDIHSQKMGELMLSPNPVDGTLFLDLSGFEKDKQVEVRVIDLVGKEAIHQTFEGGQWVNLNVSPLSASAYIIRAGQFRRILSSKFIKK